jgi:TPR repeat protein
LTPAELKDFASEKNKADAGNANGLYNLGVFYDNGHGVARNKAQAIVCWRKSAELGYAPAMFNLGYVAINGDGMKPDPVQGAAWYLNSAKLGHVPALCNLGICYADGVGVPVDILEAATWLRRAVAAGDSAAAARLELMKSELLKTFEALKVKAGRGDAKAQHKLAMCYLQGIAVPRDSAEATKWFRKAAEQGSAEAQFYLGARYLNGDGVPKNELEAVKWYRKSVDQGFVEAQFNLGVCYADGAGVPQDEVAAFKWYQKAAEQGFDLAQGNLGVRYYNGIGVTKNKVEAYAWFSLAALTNAHDQDNLAQCKAELSPVQIAAGKKRFEELQALIKKNTGQANKSIAPGTNAVVSASKTVAPTANTGTDSNDAKSIEDLRLKAERGDAKAQYKLAVCYVLGDGMPKNQIEANKWFKKAEAQGYTGQ